MKERMKAIWYYPLHVDREKRENDKMEPSITPTPILILLPIFLAIIALPTTM
jgi:hypothetical protein